jgi:RNA polymerase sigma factor (sigma-70 family)
LEERRAVAPATVAEAADAAAMRRLDRVAVLDAVARLPRRQRECVVLRYYEGLSESQAAAALGVSKNSVKKHMQRAGAALAEQLKGSR